MPYVPPGSDTVQPIAIPIRKTHQMAEGTSAVDTTDEDASERHRASSLPVDEGSSNPLPLSLSLRTDEEVPTPKASDSTVSDSIAGAAAIESAMDPTFANAASAEPPAPQRSGSQSQHEYNGITLDSLSSALASSSLSTSPKAFLAASSSSAASTPPLEESSRSLHQSSPAASSIVSLPEQEEHQHIEDVKHSNSDTSLSANRSDTQLNTDSGMVGKMEGEAEEDDTEDEGRKIAGDIETRPIAASAGNQDAIAGTVLVPVPTDAERDAFTLYTEGLYAYTKTLYIQAKLSLSRAERRRQSVSIHNQFGVKQSGMEKMAAKKALARRLNG
ncbi:hypothetical protein IAT40_001963 [Kwoniella sp. CBS 6097]